MPNCFTYQENEFIIENFGRMTQSQIARHLNRGISSISRRAIRLGLKQSSLSSRDDIDMNYIIERVKNDSAKHLAQELGVSVTMIHHWILEYTGHSIKKIKYRNFNEMFFEKIDSEKKAYWLGLIFADGCVSRTTKQGGHGLVLALQSNDRYHLETFLAHIDSKHNISDRTEYKNGKEYYMSKVFLCSEKLCDNLETLGCMPRKSYSLKFPNINQVPSDLLRHFIRGVFDGDGIAYKDKRNRIYFGFCGTLDMMQGIQSFLINHGLPKNKIREHCSIYEMMYSASKDIKTFSSLMYDEATVYLKRKKQILLPEG